MTFAIRAYNLTINNQYSESPMRPAGFEPTTFGLGNRRSILLSYERPETV